MDGFELQRGRNCLPWGQEKCFKDTFRGHCHHQSHRLSSAISPLNTECLMDLFPTQSPCPFGIFDDRRHWRLLASPPLDIFVPSKKFQVHRSWPRNPCTRTQQTGRNFHSEYSGCGLAVFQENTRRLWSRRRPSEIAAGGERGSRGRVSLVTLDPAGKMSPEALKSERVDRPKV